MNGGQLTAPLYQCRYNDQGQMVELVDPLGRETRLVFSEQGQQTSRTLPLGFGADGKLGTSDDSVGWPHFGRPQNHHLLPDPHSRKPFNTTSDVVQMSFEGVVTRLYEYDNEHGNGRLVEKQFFDNPTQFNAGMGVPSESQLYSYDAFGRMISTEWTFAPSGQPGGVSPRSDVWTNSYDTQGR